MDSARVDFAALHRAHVAALGRAYARVLDEEKLDAVVLHSGTPTPRTRFDDQFWPLRPTPWFQHWLPLAIADSALVVTRGRPRLVWLREQNFWERAPEPDAQVGGEWRDTVEIVEVTSEDALRAELPRGRVALVAERGAWGLPDASPSLMRALDRLRVGKTPYELACIDEANRVAAVGHRRVAEAFRAGGASELELHLAYLAATQQDDAETPYKNIVALGRHAATLHHVHYQKTASSRPAESLLLDAGAACRGYCSDITRTYVKGEGAAASTFAELVARTERMQRALCDEVAVGLPYERLHERAHEKVGAILSELGVVRASADEAVATGLTRAFFPHGLGHSLGLVCHDVGCAELKPKPENPFLRNTSTIAPDQVFTVEPGIYFIDMLLDPLRQNAAPVDWRLTDALAELGGVRIEDDLRVVPSGHENLTRRHLP